MKKRFSLIAAMGAKRAIGVGNHLPWHIPEDLAHFQTLTLDKMVVMGRKTFESLPNKPLFRRINVVMTKQPDFAHAHDGSDVLVAHNWQQVEDLAAHKNVPEEVMVMGGEQIYKEALPHATTAYITKVPRIVPGADTFFPPLPEKEWQLTDTQNYQTERHGKITFQKWEKGL